MRHTDHGPRPYWSLPPAYEGKVLFSQVSVHTWGGGGGTPFSIPQYFNWSHVLSRGYPSDWSKVPLFGGGGGGVPWPGMG